MRFSQKQVARLMGLHSAGMMTHYERGRVLPPLRKALSLSVILRVPVEFLFPALYQDLRSTIRAQEQQLTVRPQEQLTLFP